MMAYELPLGIKFSAYKENWIHCGWYSAVGHIAAINTATLKKKVIAHVERVVPSEDNPLTKEEIDDLVKRSEQCLQSTSEDQSQAAPTKK